MKKLVALALVLLVPVGIAQGDTFVTAVINHAAFGMV